MYNCQEQQVAMDRRFFSFNPRLGTLDRHYALEPDLGTSSCSYESVVSPGGDDRMSCVSQEKMSLQQRQQLALEFVEQSSRSHEDGLSDVASLADIHGDLKIETSALSSWVEDVGAQFSLGDFDDDHNRSSFSENNMGFIGRTRTRETKGRLSFVTGEDEEEIHMSSFPGFSRSQQQVSMQSPLFKNLGNPSALNSFAHHHHHHPQLHQQRQYHDGQLQESIQQFQLPGQYSSFDDATVTMGLPSFGSSPRRDQSEESIIMDQWDRGMSPPSEKRQKLMSASPVQQRTSVSVIHHSPLGFSMKDTLASDRAARDDGSSVESTITNMSYQAGVSRLPNGGALVVNGHLNESLSSQFSPNTGHPPLAHLQQVQPSFAGSDARFTQGLQPAPSGTPVRSVQSPHFDSEEKIPINGESGHGTRVSAMSTVKGLEDPWPPSLGLSLKGLTGLGSSHDANTMEQLLVMCAQALEKKDLSAAHQIMFLLNNMVSLEGDPNQRVASCFLKALTRRAGRTVPSFNAMYGVERVSKVVSAVEYAVMVDITPWYRFGFKAANGAMLEAFEGKDRVHIIDFTTTYGMQWPTMIEALSGRPEGAPQVRLTVCKARPDVAPYLGMSQEDVITRLRLFAATKNVELDVTVIPHELDLLDASMFEIREDEVTVANCMYRTRFIPDESADSGGQCCSRDNFFAMLHSLNPSLVTVVDEEVNVTSPSLVTRLKAAFNYLWIPFDSLDTFLPRDSSQRLEYELVLAKKIENIIVAEGLERIERMETKERWGQRLKKAGFDLVPFSEDVSEEVKLMLSDHAAGWGMKQDEDAMLLTWKGHNVLFATVWRPSLSPSISG